MNLIKRYFEDGTRARQIIGIDVGSRSIEVVLLEVGQAVHQVKLPTSFDPLAQCQRLLDGSAPGPHRGLRLWP